jgi:hypothetical protein
MSRTPTATSEQPPATQAAAPTGYLVSIVPGAIEVSARLATADKLRGLMKALKASTAILAEEPEPDIDHLSKRLPQINAA